MITPHQLAATVRRAHAIGERKENQIGIENYPREWQDMIVAALEALGAAQAPAPKTSADEHMIGKYRADYSRLTPEEIAQEDEELKELYANSRPLSR
jgi:hypothetical protein